MKDSIKDWLEVNEKDNQVSHLALKVWDLLSSSALIFENILNCFFTLWKCTEILLHQRIEFN